MSEKQEKQPLPTRQAAGRGRVGVRVVLLEEFEFLWLYSLHSGIGGLSNFSSPPLSLPHSTLLQFSQES
jgi:hypothetical protein